MIVTSMCVRECIYVCDDILFGKKNISKSSSIKRLSLNSMNTLCTPKKSNFVYKFSGVNLSNFWEKIFVFQMASHCMNAV